MNLRLVRLPPSKSHFPLHGALGRISRLCDPAYTGLHRFLAGDDAGQSGVMMLEYVATAAVGRIRANAQPVSLQTVNLSLGAEEDASFATLGDSRCRLPARTAISAPTSTWR